MYALKRQDSPKRPQACIGVHVPKYFISLSLTALLLSLAAPASSWQAPAGPLSPANISGSVADSSGAPISGARIKLIRTDHSQDQEALSGNDGQFVFTNVAPGPFQITIAAKGFAARSSSGVAHAAEIVNLPTTVLEVATLNTDVQVTLSPAEITADQLKAEEKQRLLGLIPNYYISYSPQAAPLTSRQKFTLALKSTVDPFAFGVAAVIAGVQQWQNDFAGYGQGAQGYGKRYGASYADYFNATLIGGAILPSLFKQDPRYFVKGSGTKRSRALYAIANAFIRKGDNGRWQPDYSDILGSLAAAGISNLYYPAGSRNGVGLTFENTAIGIGGTALGNIFEEFLSRKLTPSVNQKAQSKP